MESNHEACLLLESVALTSCLFIWWLSHITKSLSGGSAIRDTYRLGAGGVCKVKVDFTCLLACSLIRTAWERSPYCLYWSITLLDLWTSYVGGSWTHSLPLFRGCSIAELYSSILWSIDWNYRWISHARRLVPFYGRFAHFVAACRNRLSPWSKNTFGLGIEPITYHCSGCSTFELHFGVLWLLAWCSLPELHRQMHCRSTANWTAKKVC